jgi:hypothetical protein
MKKPLVILFSLVPLAILLHAQTTTLPKTKKLEVRRATGTKASPSASATYTMFPFHDTIDAANPRQISGCGCGQPTLMFSPTSVTTKVNTPVQIRYDASKICNEQTIRDLNGVVHPYVDKKDDSSDIGNLTLGTVQWEVGAVSDLPLEWGIITYNPGYVQPTTEEIKIEVKVQCYDSFPGNCKLPGNYNTCSSTGVIPVTVTQ